MKELHVRLISLAIFACVVVEASEFNGDADNEDAKLNVRQLIEKYGYRGETHTLQTDDGYILGLHRITGPKGDGNPKNKQPVLIIHPLLCSSADFVITGPGRALGYVLADEGYDVWLGNVRGNVYSRRHKTYTTLDKKYWDFSWHESGVQDLPVMIDHILRITGRQQIMYVGHSLGTTIFWVMASERPEYQKKVKAMIALAPVAYLTHMRSPVYHVLAKFSNNIEQLANLLGRYEFKPAEKLLKELKLIMCKDEAWSQPICTNVIFLVAGFGSDQLNTTMLPNILGHVPAGGSVKQVLHYLQVLKAQKFQQYDYGALKNLLKYKQRRPPVYALSNITVPVYVHYASNDWLSDPRDVDRLYEELGNSMVKSRVANDGFSHLDYLWGIDSKRLVYDKIVDQLRINED